MKKNKAGPRPSLPNSRKALRKQKRQEKKQHRQEHYLKKKDATEKPRYTPGRFVKRPADAPDPDVESKKKKRKFQPSSQDILSRQQQKDQKEVKKLNSQMEEQRRKMLLNANEDEDKIIKKLEKQLGLNKAKNKNNYFTDDGLDYLLEICDRTTTEQIVAAEKHLADVENESDFEEDLAAVTGKETTKDKHKEKKKQKDKIKHKDNSEHGDESEQDEISEDLAAVTGKETIKDKQKEKKKQKDKKDKKKDKNNSALGDESEQDEISEGSSEDFDGSEDEELSDEDIGDESDDDGSELEAESDVEDDLSDSEPEEKPTKSQKSKQKETLNKKQETKTKTDKPSKERIISEDDLSKAFSDDEVSHLSEDDDDGGELSGDEIDDGGDKKGQKEKPDVWEDIYGRKRDKKGNVIKEEKGVYIPPHLRNKDSTSEKDLTQLKRQIKSVLNKLAGTNLHWACTSIENLYSNNSRHSVNTTLSQLWLDATVGPSMTPDRMVAEHACLVAVLHANVAMEIGAHFLQELTKRFDDLMQTPQPVGDKTLDNLVSCLAHLYSFKIYHATLLYDILTRLLESLTEKSIECVLVALRSVGGVLRKEEPLALKEFIHDTQGRVGKISEDAATGSRIKFLLEVLLAVKNNNLTKIPGYDPSYCDQLKKSMKGVIRKGNYITPLNIRLEDLLKADERGKWWIVGSAWEGNRPMEQKPSQEKPPPSTDQRLLRLAREQRMNTDVRRSVFCVIMGAEDYMDAFEKLQHLGLRGQQEREIIHVLLACCLNERTYNPYYAVLGQKLCDTDRKYQLSIQYSVWDKIKDLENLSNHNTSNLAQFLVHLIMEKGLPLSVLKIIEFSDLNKKTVKFMRQILLSIIMNADLQSSLEVFHRISKSPKLHMFRESLKLFIQHFLIKNAGKKNNVLSDEEMNMLKDRAVEVDKILTLHESKLQF